jgi:hypothetical protein
MLLPKVSFVSAAFLFIVVVVSTASCHSAVSASASAHYPSISPHRVNYNILANSLLAHEDQHTTAITSITPLLDALRKGSGIVSITDIPNKFHNVKLGLMSHLHDCITSIDDNAADAAGEDRSISSSVGIPTENYHEGTLRKSFATSTLPNESGAQPIKILEEFINNLTTPSSYDGVASCIHFKDQLSSFRSTVDSVTKLFATQLSHEMEEGTVFLNSSTSSSQPLLRNSDPNGVDYMNINQIVNGGVHLEHFHSYQKNKKVGVDNNNDSNNNIEDDSYYEEGDEEKKKTIDFHTDQGFFIAFTPGMIVSPIAAAAAAAAMQTQELPLSNGFYIQDITSGERMHLVFTEEDELVFMMGDGVNQL